MTSVRSPKQLLSKEGKEKELEEKIATIYAREIEEKTKGLAQKLGLPYLNLKTFPVELAALFLVSETDAHSGQLAIISRSGRNIQVAVNNPKNPQTESILEQLKKDGYQYQLVIVSEPSLASAWRRYQLKGETQVPLGIISIKETELTQLQNQIKDIASLKERLAGMPVTEVVGILVAGALKIKASDIHLEPAENQIRLRYRLDGVLYDVVNFPPKGYSQLLSRIKLLSNLKINIHDVPQDGRFTIRQGNNDIEVRVSILPGAYGENIVMRILDPATIRQKLEDLGMSRDVLNSVKRLLQKTTGAILTTGPTGAGKTTTLYAFVQHINSPEIKTITIEDPVEYHIEGISQTQVDPEAGYTFAGGLRSIVRQDPDVILVGEIRDKETAEIAMQAALTGHLVLSTLHTNNAAGAIPRLIDLGVKPVTIAPAINATMAQRLIRRLCPNCQNKKRIEPVDFETVKKYLAPIAGAMKIDLTENMEIFYPGQCQKCNTTGYLGRIGVYELFEIDAQMENLILKSPAISEIQNQALAKGMVSLIQDGLLKVLTGTTSVEEVLRVIGE